MAFTIRGMTLHENDYWPQSTVGRAGMATERRVRLTGEESAPPRTVAEAEAIARNIAALTDSDDPLPIVAATSSDLTGWYRVRQATATVRRHQDTVVVLWAIDADRLGRDGSDSQLEATLTGPRPRTSPFPTAGEAWHGLPAAAVAPFYGTSSPSIVNRTTVAGDVVVVSRSIPEGACRYILTPADALIGAVALQMAGQAVLGRSGHDDSPTDWQLDNGLVRVRHSSTEAFRLSCSNGSAWESEEDWRVTAVDGSVGLGQPSSVQILRNDIAMAALRLVWEKDQERVTADLALRRGSRYATVVVRSSAGSTIGLHINDTSVANEAGYRYRGADDSDGNRWVLGTPDSQSNTDPSGWRGIERTGGLLNAFAGLEVGGSSAAAGDARLTMWEQYMSDQSELTRVIQP